MTTPTSPRLAYLTFTIWALLALPAVLAGAFAIEPGEASTGLALQLAGVVAATLLGVAVWPRLRASVLALDPVLLTSLQGWRILGMMFLFLMVLGQLPPVFAIPAGVGDLAVGLAAPFVADRMRKGTLTRRGLAWFTALGILDFVAAFAFGNYVNLTVSPDAGFASMAALPLVLVPGFFVPAFAMLHLAAWISFRKGRRRVTEDASRGAGRPTRAAAALALLLMLPAAAPGEVTIGGSYGESLLHHDLSSLGGGSWTVVERDDRDSGWKVFARFDLLSTLGIEAGYADLNNDVDGSPTLSALSAGSDQMPAGPVSLDLDEPETLYLALVGSLPLGRALGTAKAGVHSWSVDQTIHQGDRAEQSERSGESPMAGLGLEIPLGPRISTRIEVERFFDLAGDDFDLASIGLAIRLGRLDR